jgi:Fe-S oxidoreductase/nitrate reductase gamma subunit
MTPFRDDLWNLPHWFYTLHWIIVIICGALVVYGLWRRIRLWRMGGPAARTDHVGHRIGRMAVYALGQARNLTQIYPGTMHAFIFYGFIAFFIGTSLVGIEMDLKLMILRGPFYLGFETVLNTFALLFLLGLGIAAFRRYIQRPKRLNIRRDDALVLGLLAYIALSGLSLEVMRLRGQQPPWAEWSWLGNALSQVFGPPTDGPAPIYPFVWWSHQLATFGLIATLPYTKFLHIVTAPANIFLSRRTPVGALSKIENIEEAEGPLGVGAIPQFSWKQLLDADACTECGRCQAACPAFAANQPLSPKYVIINYRDKMSEYPGKLWRWQEPIVDRLPFLRRLALGTREPTARELVGEVVEDKTLWSCTTCRACEQQCPVFIEHVTEIVDMRRYLTLEAGRIPDTVTQALRNTERQGNPWGQPRHKRADWAEGLDVPIMADVGEAEVLYWVGCAGSYDPRNQKVSRAMVHIMRAAGVNFAILGEEESCNAEWARRAGEEYLYQVQAEANVETLKQYRFKRIVTQCPHCFNTLKNEYPQFGGQWEVVHHSQFIRDLIGGGRLKLSGMWHGGKVTFHDSCYLGRYNQVYDPPRDVLKSVPDLHIDELDRSRVHGFCCGGGGAGMWMEHPPDQQINAVRMDEIQALNPDLAAVACPFCLIMLDAVASSRGLKDKPALQDIAEVIAAVVSSPPQVSAV